VPPCAVGYGMVQWESSRRLHCRRTPEATTMATTAYDCGYQYFSGVDHVVDCTRPPRQIRDFSHFACLPRAAEPRLRSPAVPASAARPYGVGGLFVTPTPGSAHSPIRRSSDTVIAPHRSRHPPGRAASGDDRSDFRSRNRTTAHLGKVFIRASLGGHRARNRWLRIGLVQATHAAVRVSWLKKRPWPYTAHR
jgi:hypothetical protein